MLTRLNRHGTAASLLVLGATLSAGCAPQTATTAAPSATSAPTEQRAEVTVDTITPVISLAGIVQTSTAYAITSPASGLFMEVPGGGQVTTEAGVSVAIEIHDLDRDTIALVPNNAPVVMGLPVFSAVYAGFTLTAGVEGVNLLKLRTAPESVRAQIHDVGGPFDCTLLDNRPSQIADGSFAISCPVPVDLDVLSGLTGVIALQYPAAKDVLTLPLEAVAGTFDSASVYVANRDGVALRTVEVGVNDGVRIEIRTGLERGDVVSIPTPSLLGRQ